MPASASSNSDWPLPATPGDADDLPGAQLEAHALHARHAEPVAHLEVAHGEQRFAGMRGRLLDAQQHGAADHFFGQLARRRVARGDFADDRALPHDGDAVGDRP